MHTGYNYCINRYQNHNNNCKWSSPSFEERKASETRQRKAWHSLAGGGGQSWPQLTLWPKIRRVSLLIINNLHTKRLDKNCSLYHTHKQSPKVDLWHNGPKSIGFLLSSSTTCMRSLKVIGQKLLSVSCPQGFIHSVKVDLDLWPRDPKSIGFLLSSLTNVHVKFESDWAKTVFCIVPTRYYT